MYLSYLRKRQKELFLDLSLIVSKVDDEFSVAEKNLIDQLCQEMDIEPKKETAAKLEDILVELEDISSPKDKKIILLEILGIVMIDNDVNVAELDLIKLIVEKFALQQKDVDNAIDLINRLYSVYADFSNFINEKV